MIVKNIIAEKIKELTEYGGYPLSGIDIQRIRDINNIYNANYKNSFILYCWISLPALDVTRQWWIS